MDGLFSLSRTLPGSFVVLAIGGLVMYALLVHGRSSGLTYAT